MTKARLVAALEAGLIVEGPSDAAGLFPFALREGELYTLYQWQPGGRLTFETLDDAALLAEKAAGRRALECWRRAD